jgi:hypothetical protein
MKTIELLDICLPDYFTGYSLPVLAVPMYGKTTFKELADLLKGEFNACFEYINEENSEEITSLYETYFLELSNKEGLFFDAEEIGEDIEPAYAYFSICNMKTINGITFLN